MAEPIAAIAERVELPTPALDAGRFPISLRAWDFMSRLLEKRFVRVSTIAALGASTLAMALPNQIQQMVLSDVQALAEDITNTAPTINERDATTYQSFEFDQADFSGGNGKYRNSHFDWSASVWHVEEALDSSYTLSIQPGPHQAEYDSAYNQTLAGLVDYRRTAPDNRRQIYFISPNSASSLPVLGLLVEQGALNDDNTWIAKQMVRAYRNTHNPAYLKNAEQILQEDVSQWDPNGGGTYWMVQPAADKQRAAVSNATVADLAYNLFEITHNKAYLPLTKKYFNWTQHNLHDPKTGLFYDHITGTKVDKTIWSYVQGEEALDMADLSQVGQYPVTKTVDFVNRALRYFNYCRGNADPEFRGIFEKDVMKIVAKKVDGKQPYKVLLPGINTCSENAAKYVPIQPNSLKVGAGVVLVKALANLSPKYFSKLA